MNPTLSQNDEKPLENVRLQIPSYFFLPIVVSNMETLEILNETWVVIIIEIKLFSLFLLRGDENF